MKPAKTVKAAFKESISCKKQKITQERNKMKVFKSKEMYVKTEGKSQWKKSLRRLLSIALAMTFIFGIAKPAMATQEDGGLTFSFDEMETLGAETTNGSEVVI